MSESTLPEPPKSASLPAKPQASNGSDVADSPEKPPAPADLPPTPASTTWAPLGNRDTRDKPPSFNINNPMGKKIFIAQLPEDTTEEDLELCFGAIGPIVSVELKRGFGFVEFKDATDASKACAEYDGGKFLDATIHVSLSHGAGRRGDGPSHCYRCGQEGHWANSKQCPFAKESPHGHRRDNNVRPGQERGGRNFQNRRDDRPPFPPRGADRNFPPSGPPIPEYPFPPQTPYGPGTPIGAPGPIPGPGAYERGAPPYPTVPPRDPYAAAAPALGYDMPPRADYRSPYPPRDAAFPPRDPPYAPRGGGAPAPYPPRGDVPAPYPPRDTAYPPRNSPSNRGGYGPRTNGDRRGSAGVPTSVPGPVDGPYHPYPFDPYRSEPRGYPGYPPVDDRYMYYQPPPPVQADPYGYPNSAPLPYPYDRSGPGGYYPPAPAPGRAGEPAYLPRPRTPPGGGRGREPLGNGLGSGGPKNGPMGLPASMDRRGPGGPRRRSLSPPARRNGGPNGPNGGPPELVPNYSDASNGMPGPPRPDRSIPASTRP